MKNIERVKGTQKREVGNGVVREYDYKTIQVKGGLHYALRLIAAQQGKSVNRLIHDLLLEKYPNTKIDNIPAITI